MSQYPGSNPSPGTGTPTGAPVGSGTLVAVGLGLAVLAVILMNVYVELRVSAAQEDTITIFKFNGSLDAGTEIEPKHITPVEIPESFAKAFGADVIRERPDSPGTPADGLGFELNSPVVQGEALRSSLFTGEGRRAARNNPELGEHQIALSVDSDDQPADLAPGDRIDLYGAIPMSRSTQYMVVMEYVEVAAVGERRTVSGDGKQANKYGSITINIDPKQVPLLFDIQQRLPDNEFRISLRAPNDTRTEITGGEAKINEKVLAALRLK